MNTKSKYEFKIQNQNPKNIFDSDVTIQHGSRSRLNTDALGECDDD